MSTDRKRRRLEVRFRRPQDSVERLGYTSNISPTGMFVSTPRPLPPNARLVAEIRSRRTTFRLRAITVHALRTPALLQSIKPSGMGVRFLEGDDLVRLGERFDEL